MICRVCGIFNNDKNKHCTACGGELKVNSSSETANDTSDTHDKYLGKGINRSEKSSRERRLKSHKKTGTSKKLQGMFRKHSEGNSKGVKVLWISVGLIITSVLLVASLDLIFHKYPKKIPLDSKSNNPLIESKVTEIASKFICSCGKCGEISLDVCTCRIALEERKIIREALEQNQRVDQIVYTVANNYGWLKSQYSNLYSVDKSQIWHKGSE